LLIEESRTNLILQSEDFDTTWAETRATLVLNQRVSPNGTLTADRLIASVDNDTHFTTQTFTGTAVAHTFSVYAKTSGLSHIALRLFNGTSQVGLAYYNLLTGATGTVTAGTATITNVGNGWYRCSLTATLAASASCTADIYLANADNVNSFAGNAYNGVSLWGAQLEAGAFPTSYIPTVASQVTRSADAASMTGTNFSSWYRADEGTMYGDASTPFAVPATHFMQVMHINNGTATNSIRISFNTESVSSAGSTTNNVVQVDINTSSLTGVRKRVIAFAYSVNNFAASTNGVTALTDTSGILPVVSQMNIGVNATGASISTLSGHIRKIAYYPLRVTNAELQALTS
jgi:hypothetical protein